MEKRFDEWNEKKKDIHIKARGPFCHPREIWWCSLGVNIGREEDGSGVGLRRPVLVLKKLSPSTRLVVPLTTERAKHPLRLSIGLINGRRAQAVLSQIRVVDTKRFRRKIGYLGVTIFEETKTAIRNMI